MTENFPLRTDFSGTIEHAEWKKIFDDIYSQGYCAYMDGKMKAPMVCNIVQAIVADRPVGDPHTMAAFRAFTDGFEDAATAAANAVIAEDTP